MREHIEDDPAEVLAKSVNGSVVFPYRCRCSVDLDDHNSLLIQI